MKGLLQKALWSVGEEWGTVKKPLASISELSPLGLERQRLAEVTRTWKESAIVQVSLRRVEAFVKAQWTLGLSEEGSQGMNIPASFPHSTSTLEGESKWKLRKRGACGWELGGEGRRVGLKVLTHCPLQHSPFDCNSYEKFPLVGSTLIH